MKNKITKEHIDGLIEDSEIKIFTVFDKVTLVAVKLPNGFVLTESSGAVDKKNYDLELGKEACMDRITNKLWELEGYALTSKLTD